MRTRCDWIGSVLLLVPWASGCDGRPAAAAMELQPGSLVCSSSTRHDFGSVLEGSVLTHVFELENRGPGFAVLDSVVSDCSCTVALSSVSGGSPRPYREGSRIPCGDMLQVQVSFDTLKHAGRSDASVRLGGDSLASTPTLEMVADVAPMLALEPAALDLGVISARDGGIGTIEISSPALRRLRLGMLQEALPDGVRAELHPDALDPEGFARTWQLSITVGPTRPASNLFIAVPFVCTWPSDPGHSPDVIGRLPTQAVAHATARIVEGIAVIPEYIAFGSVGHDTPQVGSARIVSYGDEPLSIAEADVRVSEVEGCHSVRPSVTRVSSREYLLELSLTPERGSSRVFRGTLDIRVGTGPLQVQFFGLVAE